LHKRSAESRGNPATRQSFTLARREGQSPLAQLEQFKPRFRKFGEGGFNEIIDLCLA
jgi:hypothetical protein